MAGATTAQSDSPNVDPAAAPRDPAPQQSDNKTTASASEHQPDQKKDRKPRRERLPLPDPIPDTPVKRYPEPSKPDLQARIDAEDAKLQHCFDRLNSTRVFFDQRQKIRDSGKPAFDHARKRFTELNDRCRALFEERKTITVKLKAIKDEDIAARSAATSSSNEIPGAGKEGNDALRGVRTMEELEQRIAQLKYRQETESMPMAEEKRIINQISFLSHKGRDFIRSRDDSLKGQKAAKEARLSTRAELEDARKALDSAIDSEKEKLDAQKKVVDDIRAKQEQEIQKLQKDTATIDRDEEKKKIGEIKTVIRKMREDYQVELDKWYLNERIHIEQQKIAKRKKFEAAQADREARRKAWEAEQAQYPEPHPYQEEKDMCSGLTVYLQTLLGETVEKPTANLLNPGKGDTAPSLKTTSNTREISSKGKAIGKSTTDTDGGFESLAFSDFVKKSGKSKNKKGRGRSAGAASTDMAGGEDVALKPHSIDYLTAFTRLEIKPPNRINEVRVALEAVKAKAAYYETAPAPSAEEKAKRAEAKKKQSQPSEKKMANGSDLMNGENGAAAFPGLQPEASAPTRVRDTSMPSFMAVASGVASAPPATAADSAAELSGVTGMNNGQLVMDNLNEAAEAARESDGISAPRPEPSMAEA